jgi:hypothetical protein
MPDRRFRDRPKLLPYRLEVRVRARRTVPTHTLLEYFQNEAIANVIQALDGSDEKGSLAPGKPWKARQVKGGLPYFGAMAVGVNRVRAANQAKGRDDAPVQLKHREGTSVVESAVTSRVFRPIVRTLGAQNHLAFNR